MNRRTDRQSDLRRMIRASARWGAAIALAAVVFVTWLSNYNITVSPWMLAGGAMLRDAMSEFSGGGAAGSAGSPADRFRVLAGILLGFIAAPTLFLVSWRALRTREDARPLTVAAFIAGAGLTLAFTAPSIPVAIAQERQFHRMKEQNAVYRTKDRLMAELNRVSASAYDYWILPGTRGGGNRSFTGYRVPPPDGGGSFACEIREITPGKISFKASAPDYPGSSVSLEVDTTGSVRFTGYEGLFKM